MAIKFECPHCHRKFSVADAMAGKKGKCPGCAQALMVPTTSEAAAEAAQPPLPPAPVPRSLPSDKGSNGASHQPDKPSPAKPAPPKAGPGKPTPAPNRTAAAFSPAAPPSEVEDEAAEALADEPAGKPAEPEWIEFDCEWCGEKLKLPLAEAGKRVSCSECRRIVKVPEIKKEKKDWRDTNPGLPSGALGMNVPQPEGAWTGATRRGAKEYENEGILPTTTPPLTWSQRITRIAIVVVLAGGVLWGGWAGYSWWKGRSDASVLQESVKYAEKDGAAQLGRERTAALYSAIFDYHRRSRKPGSAAESQEYFKKALGLLNIEGNSLEGDFLLLDLAVAEIDLAGQGEEVDTGIRIKWDQVQPTIKAALQAIRSPQVRLEALRRVGRRLVARKEAKRVLALTNQVYSSNADADERVNALAEMGLELDQAGVKDETEKAATQVLPLFEKDNAKNAPKVTAAVIALALLKKKDPPKAEKGSTGKEKTLLGKTDGQARLGQRKESREEITAEGDPVLRLQAWLRLAPQDGADLAKAIEQATAPDLKNTLSLVSWELYRLVALGIQAELGEAKLQPVVDSILDPALQGRAQLELLRSKLLHSSAVVPETEVDRVGPIALNAQARLALAEHNTRQDNGWAKVARAWQEPNKVFGALGAVLGMGPKE